MEIYLLRSLSCFASITFFFYGDTLILTSTTDLLLFKIHIYIYISLIYYLIFPYTLFVNSNAAERRVERENIQNGAGREVKSES